MRLYNRYVSGAWPESAPETHITSSQYIADAIHNAPAYTDLSQIDEASHPTAERTKSSTLKGLFGGNIKLPEFDADTILLLVLVYFLVADDTENISDTLLIIGVLLLLGF